MTNTAAEILYAEDNEDDVELIRTGLKRCGVPVNLHHVENGADCLRFLRREGAYANAPRPHLLLLDLNMPVLDGYEVMETIVKDPALRCLPVVVLTTSNAPEDVERLYRLRCNSYICKPLELQQWLKMVETIVEYWFKVVTLPTGHPGGCREIE